MQFEVRGLTHPFSASLELVTSGVRTLEAKATTETSVDLPLVPLTRILCLLARLSQDGDSCQAGKLLQEPATRAAVAFERQVLKGGANGGREQRPHATRLACLWIVSCCCCCRRFPPTTSVRLSP